MPLFARPADISWTDWLRQILSFLLGLGLIVYGVFVSDNSLVPELIIGLLLMGLVPVDVVLTHLGVGRPATPPPSPPPPVTVVSVEEPGLGGPAAQTGGGNVATPT